jgi:hypothetical protein
MISQLAEKDYRCLINIDGDYYVMANENIRGKILVALARKDIKNKIPDEIRNQVC